MIKMRRKLFLCVILVLLVGFLGLTLKLFNASFTQKSVPETSAFFVTLPLTEFTPIDTPRLDVEIEGRRFTMELDLGFQCKAGLVSDLLPKIKDKTFQKIVNMYGAGGQLHKLSRYTIPLMKIGSVSFQNLTLDELTQSEREDGIIEPDKHPVLIEGALGWVLFTKHVLFLDFCNSQIIIADSIETFKKQRSLEGFSKTSLLTEQGLLECEVTTTEGPLFCMIGTDSAYNRIFSYSPDAKPLEELSREKENFTTFTTFQIGEKEFGPTTFRPFPIALPMRVEAILGMEFLIDHQVLIDFKNNEIYFAP